jgi:transposase-like protein
MRKRRTFTAEFKREAVRQLKEGDLAPSDLARELGVPRNKLYRWKEEMETKGDVAFPGAGKSANSEGLSAENARLTRELAQAREEVDILKKATVGSTGHRNARCIISLGVLNFNVFRGLSFS